MADDLYKVIAFDPGGITGWAIFGVRMKAMHDPYKKILSNIAWWQCGEYYGPEGEQAVSMSDLALAWDDAHLVMEDFILRKFSTDRELLAPVRVQARFEQIMQLKKDPRPLILQPVDLAKSTTDEQLKAYGRGFFEGTVALKDARMAVKHGLLWLRRAKKLILLNEATRAED